MMFKAGPGVQEALVASDPDRFFVPAYVGHKGWVGTWLTADQDWDEIAELIEDSYRLIAPKRLAARIRRPGPGGGARLTGASAAAAPPAGPAPACRPRRTTASRRRGRPRRRDTAPACRAVTGAATGSRVRGIGRRGCVSGGAARS